MIRNVKNTPSRPTSGKTNVSKIRSVIGMYIRGEKKIEDIVHPSKITRIRDYACTNSQPVQNSMNRTFVTRTSLANPKTKSKSSCDPIVTIEDSLEDCDSGKATKIVDCANSVDRVTNELKPIKIDHVNHIKFAGKDMRIGLKSDDGKNCLENPIIDCSIHPTLRERELDLRIEPSSDNFVSEMKLKNENFILQVKSLENQKAGKRCDVGDTPDTRLVSERENVVDKMNTNFVVNCDTVGALSNASDNLLVKEDYSKHENISNGDSAWFVKSYRKLADRYGSIAECGALQCRSSIGSNTISVPSSDFENSLKDSVYESDNSEVFHPIKDDLKPLKTDVSYFREKVSQQQAQITELKSEIKKAEYVSREYNAKSKENSPNVVTKSEFEDVLKEFLDASKTSSSPTGVSNMGLDFVITDYFTKCYDNLSRKVYQCDRDRKALTIVVENLKKERNRLQNSITSVKRKISERKNQPLS